MNLKIGISVLVLIVAGCATDVANRYYSNYHYPPRPASEVAVFTNEPARPYEVIADFQSRGDTAQTLQKKAALIGADGIIVTRLGGYYNSADEWAGKDSQKDSYSRIVGTAIKYKP